jgi:hypothetical protein
MAATHDRASVMSFSIDDVSETKPSLLASEPTPLRFEMEMQVESTLQASL